MKLVRFKDTAGYGHFLSINREEAFRILKSITSQLSSDSANVGREEFRTDKGRYFSIAVELDGEKEHLKRRVKELEEERRNAWS